MRTSAAAGDQTRIRGGGRVVLVAEIGGKVQLKICGVVAGFFESMETVLKGGEMGGGYYFELIGWPIIFGKAGFLTGF